jgi:hypothetical protein
MQLKLHIVVYLQYATGSRDPKTDIYFIDDVEKFSPIIGQTPLQSVSIDEYGPSAAVEPYPCPVPGCSEALEGHTIVIQFYLDMEEETHARWLFHASRNRCISGCCKGFIKEHSRLRHY